MIGLGLAVDDGLVVVSRFWEEIAAGYDTPAAVRRSGTVVTAGRTVVFSATMIIASAGGLQGLRRTRTSDLRRIQRAIPAPGQQNSPRAGADRQIVPRSQGPTRSNWSASPPTALLSVRLEQANDAPGLSGNFDDPHNFGRT